MTGGDDYEEHGCFAVALPSTVVSVPRYCPHRAGRLDHGEVNERRGTITCPLHRSTFDLSTGEQLAGPPCGSLRVAREP